VIIPLQLVTLVFDKWRPELGTVIHPIPPAGGFVATVLQLGSTSATGGGQEPLGRYIAGFQPEIEVEETIPV
jgi:hypothetical protein